MWSAVRRDGVGTVAIVLGSSMHAVGQAFLAAAAGTLARALAEGTAARSVGRIVAPWDIGESGSDGPTLILAFSGLAAAAVKLVGGALAAWAEARLAGAVGQAVRLEVLDELLRLRGLRKLRTPRHHDHGPADEPAVGTQAEQFAALTSHIGDIERGVAHGVLAEWRAMLQLVPLGLLLVVLAPKLAGSAVVALGGFGLLAFSLRRAFKRAHARALADGTVLVAAADEAVRHAELWATYGAGKRVRAHVARIGRTIAREAARIRVRASLLSSTSEVLGAVALVLALFLAARGYLGVERATVVPFAIAFFMTYRPLRDLVDARLARSRGEAALHAVGADHRAPAKAASLPRRGANAWSLADFTLTEARARHGQHAPLSVVIPAGSIVAIVGPTGVGKSSLLRALLGLAPLERGTLRYGGVDLGGRDVGPSERPFAWVPQDAPVVSDTLAINVGLGQADDDVALPDPAAILAALGNAALAESLGDAVLTTTRPLSGGERQWVAVARALATGLPVLLLDEPTSALDPASQGRLLDALQRLRGQRTVIIVTHRPEPLAIADVVVRLEPIRASSPRGATAMDTRT